MLMPPVIYLYFSARSRNAFAAKFAVARQARLLFIILATTQPFLESS
jgi:hypothetical protein